MMPRLAWRWLAGVAVALSCLSGSAGAQTLLEEERPTLRLGPVEVRPRVRFRDIGVDNNVFNERERPKADWTFTAQPDVEVSIRPRRARIVWSSGAEYVYYEHYKSERAVNRSQVLSADVDLRFLRPFASFGTAHTSARPNAEIDVRARRHPTNYAFGTQIRLGTRTSALLSVRGSRERYDGNARFRGQELARTLNNRGRIYEGIFGLELTPLTTLNVAVSQERAKFPGAPLRDSTSTRVSPTLSFSPLGLLNGTLSVGYRRFRGMDATLPGYTGLAMDGSLAAVLGGRYRVETRITRDVHYSYEEKLPYYVLTGGRGTVATQVSDRCDVRLTLGRDKFNYRAFAGGTSPPADSVQVYGAGLGVRLGDQRRFVVQAELNRRRSDRDRGREFSNHRVVATMTWGV